MFDAQTGLKEQEVQTGVLQFLFLFGGVERVIWGALGHVFKRLTVGGADGPQSPARREGLRVSLSPPTLPTLALSPSP